MAESSTCLVQSFTTHADTSSCVNEGNPLRALGESISFGRFMSESLEWEKWSAFSPKRYVEEAEKYSKPGSVAEKKAYFEAHYKRKAAEKAAVLVQKSNVQANGTFHWKTWEGNCVGSSAQITSEADNIETINEEINENIVNYQVVDCDDTNQCNCDDVGQNDLEMKSEADNIEITKKEINEDTVDHHVVHSDDTNQCDDVGENDLDIAEVERAEEVLRPCNDMNLNVESCVSVDNSNQLDHVVVDKNITIPFEKKTSDPGISGHEVLALPVKGREISSSSKSSVKTRPEKPPHSSDQRKASAAVSPRIGIISGGSKRENSVGNAVEKKRLMARSLRTSINLPSGTGETKKTADAPLRSRNGTNRFSASKNSVGSLVEKKRLTASSLHMSIDVPSGTGIASKTITAAVKPRNGMNIVPKSLKSTEASMEKRLTARSLHMSINLSSGAGETSKTTSGIEHNKKKKVQCNFPKARPAASRTSTKETRGLLNQAPANLPSQGRRTERLVSKSVDGDLTVNAKLSPLSVESLKSSSTTKSNPRSPTISSPFRFRSEERAIKRKEFMQKMAETKSKEEEKVQLQRTSKGKTEHTHKKLPQSSGSKSKPNDDGPTRAQSPSNQIRKISVTLPRSPRQVRQASSSSSTTKNVGSSWKPPISASNSKHITEKNNRTRQSGTSLWENASPNIQR